MAQEGLVAAGLRQGSLDIRDGIGNRIGEGLGEAKQLHGLRGRNRARRNHAAGHLVQQRVVEVAKDVGQAVDHREVHMRRRIAGHHRCDAGAIVGICSPLNAVDRVRNSE